MPFTRQACAVGVGAAVLACLVSPVTVSAGTDWPTHPIRILVGFGAGGGTDVATRIIADPLGEVLGQRIVVENKAGAGGTIAADAIAKSQKDGYNAVMASPAHTVAAAMIKAQPYDAVKDFSPVGVVANSAFVVVAKSDFPAKDMRELIALAKKEPGKLNYGSVTIGSTQHITAELLRQRAGIDAQHVSFRTTPEVVTALMRGDVSYAVELAHAVRGQVQAGDLKILAVMTANRWPSLPNVPTVIEFRHSGFRGARLVRAVIPRRHLAGDRRADPLRPGASAVARRYSRSARQYRRHRKPVDAGGVQEAARERSRQMARCRQGCRT